MAFVFVFAIGCTEVKVVDLNVASNKTINDTRFVPTVDRAEKETVIEEAPQDLIEGLCTEKVLLAIRKCKWINEENLGITIKNNGFKNITMAFYLFMDDAQVGSVFNDTLFPAKEEWTFTLPMSKLIEKYGEIQKIHATPILIEEGISTSCSNKKLPVLVKSCS